MLDHAAQFVADQSGREDEGQFAAAGLVEQAGGKPGLDGMKFQFRDLAFQPE